MWESYENYCWRLCPQTFFIKYVCVIIIYGVIKETTMYAFSLQDHGDLAAEKVCIG